MAIFEWPCPFCSENLRSKEAEKVGTACAKEVCQEKQAEVASLTKETEEGPKARRRSEAAR
jgi:hypothetical protein